MSVAFPVLCFLSNLTGPPQFEFQNLSFQLWTVNKRICPDFNPYKDTVFHLYTRENQQISRVIIPHDDDSLAKSGFDYSLKTIIFFHGFLESYQSQDGQSIKNGYLQYGQYNVILVQNQRLLSGPDYITAANNCKPIGRYTAAFIDYLVSKGMKLKNLHVMGHSFGGQIAGLTGQFVRSGKIPRITAFDPAGHLFNEKPIDERIDPTDGKFVDVIYTNSGVFSMKYAAGHLNFWPNGGTKQPGCKLSEVIQRYGFALNRIVLCNHHRSYQLYVESLKFRKSFPSRKCESYKEYELGSCNNNSMAYLGILAGSQLRGNYYLDTGDSGVNI